ncbi:CLUMA_CG014329, isoform A [Clunio marinus]|uniref:CLUMA_CG014329, isoform A n=1 Tax=Clunio marinus TaxID=568069 RepID=A0A1J1IPX7_9DIPT|nr:CLUMA_CG014329, isoform A [Clunio marinus]
MSPSAGQTEHLTSNAGNDPWSQQNGKENQRPPVFFPEDYIAALKKFSKFGSNNGSHKSIYDTIDDAKADKSVVIANKSRTLPFSKTSEYSSPITPADTEMTLKQFGSITELLTKLRADLRQSFQRQKASKKLKKKSKSKLRLHNVSLGFLKERSYLGYRYLKSMAC